MSDREDVICRRGLPFDRTGEQVFRGAEGQTIFNYSQLLYTVRILCSKLKVKLSYLNELYLSK